MRALLPITLLLAACSGAGEGNNSAAQAPAPRPTGPAPRTPVTAITPEPGKTPSWLGTRDGGGDASSAPYGNVLDQPVVNGTAR